MHTRIIVCGFFVLSTALSLHSCEHHKNQYHYDQDGSIDVPIRSAGVNIFINNYAPLYIMTAQGAQVASGANSGFAATGIANTGGYFMQPSYSSGTKPSSLFRVPWMKSCYECWEAIMNSLRMHLMNAPSLYAYVRANKWSLAVKTSAVMYLILNAMLFRTSNFLTAPRRWMYWRSDILLVQLMRMSSADLIQELLASLSLQTQLSPDQKPIQMLFAELDDEICQLQQYTRWVNIITQLSHLQQYCAMAVEAALPSVLGIPVGYMLRMAITATNLKNICYINYELIQHTPDYLRRLMYLRRILEEELAVELPQVIAEPTETVA